jgi:hypothetical protein
MNILINAFGIKDAGGLKVLDKLLKEICFNTSSEYLIICNNDLFIRRLKDSYSSSKNLKFILIKNKSIFYRLYYENFIFKRLIKSENIELIYNISGSYQFFIKTLQIVKVQNLLFFSKRLDRAYLQERNFLLWLKQVYIKRLVFKLMLSKAKYIEIQSNHVKSYLSEFINTRDKIFFLKSDINIDDHAFFPPKLYNFSERLIFLYIVGLNFEYLHKNLIDFTNAMVKLKRKGLKFEINITLTKEQLENSKVWSSSLDSSTNFLGYIDSKSKIKELFCNNTILISTSIIETLGLHITEGIKNGIITIAPNEEYTHAVYGRNMFKYELFNKNSLSNTIMTVINYKDSYNDNILSVQEDLRQSEMRKFNNILDVFDEVVSVKR